MFSPGPKQGTGPCFVARNFPSSALNFSTRVLLTMEPSCEAGSFRHGMPESYDTASDNEMNAIEQIAEAVIVVKEFNGSSADLQVSLCS